MTDPATNSPVLLFHYPSTQPQGFAYLKRSVKMEFGSLTDQQPTGRHAVRPLVAEILPDAFPIGDATSSRWKSSEASGKRRRSFTPSTTGRLNGRRQIDSLGITRTRRRWLGILRAPRRLTSMI